MMTKYGLTKGLTADYIEECMLNYNLENNFPDIDLQVEHNFSDGIYMRTITMPTGSLIIGHRHKTSHLNTITKGSCISFDVETGTTTEIVAPCTFESKPGVKKIVYVVEECVWSNIHNTDEKDIDILEATLVEQSEFHKLFMENRKQLENKNKGGNL